MKSTNGEVDKTRGLFPCSGGMMGDGPQDQADNRQRASHVAR
jgi:hypothetical protein